METGPGVGRCSGQNPDSNVVETWPDAEVCVGQKLDAVQLVEKQDFVT
jgi:hypothetical protein